MNDHKWREDSGLLNEKTHLPVKQLRFGDVDVLNGFDEMGYHTLGKFKCYRIVWLKKKREQNTLLLSSQTCEGKMRATQKLILLFFFIRLIIVDPDRNLNVDTSTLKIKSIILHSVIAQTEIKVLIEPQILSQIYTSTFKVREVSP